MNDLYRVFGGKHIPSLHLITPAHMCYMEGFVLEYLFKDLERFRRECFRESADDGASHASRKEVKHLSRLIATRLTHGAVYLWAMLTARAIKFSQALT